MQRQHTHTHTQPRKYILSTISVCAGGRTETPEDGRDAVRGSSPDHCRFFATDGLTDADINVYSSERNIPTLLYASPSTVSTSAPASELPASANEGYCVMQTPTSIIATPVHSLKISLRPSNAQNNMAVLQQALCPKRIVSA